MRARSPILLTALVVADCLAWRWSVGAQSDLAAIFAGLALPALAVILAWSLTRGALGAASRAARSTRQRLSASPFPPARLPVVSPPGRGPEPPGPGNDGPPTERPGRIAA